MLSSRLLLSRFIRCNDGYRKPRPRSPTLIPFPSFSRPRPVPFLWLCFSIFHRARIFRPARPIRRAAGSAFLPVGSGAGRRNYTSRGMPTLRARGSACDSNGKFVFSSRRLSVDAHARRGFDPLAPGNFRRFICFRASRCSGVNRLTGRRACAYNTFARARSPVSCVLDRPLCRPINRRVHCCPGIIPIVFGQLFARPGRALAEGER